jgi:hypothetical protein
LATATREKMQVNTFFDGEIDRECPPEGIELGLLPERARRTVSVLWMKYLVPSSVGSLEFELITQGRSGQSKKENRYFSTCGELAMTALYVIGYRGPILNRDLEAADGGPRKWQAGKNMEYLMGHLGPQTRPRKEGAWVPWQGEEGPLPQPGDIICVTEGPSKTEHVMVMIEPVQIDEDEAFDALHVAEAGRGYIVDQNAGFGVKELHGKKVGSRTCTGFIDIGKLKLAARAKLPPDMR